MNPEAAAWTTETGWRLMFVSEAVPAGLFALLVLLVPETPRYLAMCGKDEKGAECVEPYQRRFSGKGNPCGNQGNYRRKDRKTLYLRLDGYLYRYHAERIPAGCRHQCRALFRSAHIRDDGHGQSDGTNCAHGRCQYSLTLLAVFTVEKWGRKPLLISGSVGMAIGAFGVAMCNVVTGLPAIISVISIMVYSASFMFSWGTYLLGTDCRNLPEYHPWRCGSYCGGIPMDFQLYCFVYFPCRCTICVSGRWAISSAICLHMPFTGLSAWQPPSSCGSSYPKRKARRWKI